MYVRIVTTVNGHAHSWFVLFQKSLFAQIIITVIVTCVCTRILSSHWFRSVKYGKRRNVKLPTLPYWIPGLKHALSLAYNSKPFMARSNCNAYGDGIPFFLDGAGQNMLIILDPEQIQGVLRSSTELDPNPFIHEKIMGALLGSPQEAIDHYISDQGKADYIQITHIRQHTTGSNLGVLDKRLFETLKRSIGQTLLSSPETERTEITDLYAFIEQHVTLAITETLLGSAIVQSYPGMIADLWIHIEATEIFFMGLPRFLVPKAYVARDRLLSNIRKWSLRAETLRNQGAVDTQWDPVAGSALAQEREELYSAMPGHDEHGRAAQALGLLYGGTSLTVPITFWYFYETLRNPSLHERVLTEINNHVDANTNSYNSCNSPHAPSSNPCTQKQHELTAPTHALGEKYLIEKGTTVFILNRYVAQFSHAWARARPQALARPLDAFWAERYLVAGGGDHKRERFSDAGLAGNWTSFGGGEHKCPGRHFARNIGIVTLGVLMGVFECEVCDVEGARELDPKLKERAFGTMKPSGKLAARIRRRAG
ncbi:cytochrome P450 [Decorospora gaudefroyi]|uniref:Cytochrome P450 n=1 Tax=Decorospora gaudefroyi TaxID=184978 RepID=A0A6A5JXX6_9PLEO|nr:cytochrome P450 [Decorospora gaudefroyi]